MLIQLHQFSILESEIYTLQVDDYSNAVFEKQFFIEK